MRSPIAFGGCGNAKWSKDARAFGRVAATSLIMLAVLSAPGAAVLAAACDGAYSNPVITENCATPPTSWSSDWKVDRTHFNYDRRFLAGYASASSVAPGASLNFYVQLNATIHTYRMDVYRLGWYGGAGGRLLQSMTDLVAPAQPGCAYQAVGTAGEYYTCSTWQRSHTLVIPANWVSGIYVAVLTSTAVGPAPAKTPYQAHVVFVVRDDSRQAELYYQQAVATDEAYNNSFGPGIYAQTEHDGHRVPIAKASLDRPFGVFDDMQLYRFELPFVYWLESQGYDVVYGSDLDSHEGRLVLARFRGLLTAGHSEYWSKPMYDQFVAARDTGRNLGFFSGNTLYSQMRIEDTAAPLGDASHDRHDRVMVVYRHIYPPAANGLGDPNPDPAMQTVLWRAFPVLRDEEALVGVHFSHSRNCRVHTAPWATSAATTQAAPALVSDPQPLIVADADHWVYAGTGLGNGAAVPHVYGQEADAFERTKSSGGCLGSWYEPPPVVPAHLSQSLSVLADSPFSQVSAPLGKPPIYTPTGVHVNSVIYQACSGAWVFGAGSIMWANALAPSNILGKDYSSTSIQTMSKNILDVLSGRRPAPAGGGACVPSPRPVADTVITTVLSED